MVIQKNGDLIGLSGNYHLRKGENALRVSGAGALTISTTNPDGDYDRIVAALAKGETFVDLDAEPPKPKTRAKKAPAENTSAE